MSLPLENSHLRTSVKDLSSGVLPYADESFDYISVRGLLAVAFLTELKRISRKGATLVAMFSTETDFIIKAQEHGYVFDRCLRLGSRTLGFFNLKSSEEALLHNKISVVIPMFNASSTITKALDSIAAQTIPIFEVVIVDDGSTDESVRIIDDYRLTSKLNIRLFKQSNAGPSRARNHAISMTSGDFVAFLDADDSWIPEKTEEQMRVFRNFPNTVLVACNRNGEFFSRFLIFKLFDLVKVSSKLLLLKNFFPTPTVIVKREVIDSYKFDESMKYLEDLDLWVRISQRNNCYLLNKSLVCTGNGKPSFGHSGLSRHVVRMEYGELRCLLKSWQNEIIGPGEFFLLSVYSLLKFARRLLLTFKMRL